MKIVIKSNVKDNGQKDITIIDFTSSYPTTLSFSGHVEEDKDTFGAIEKAYEEAMEKDLGFDYIQEEFNNALGVSKSSSTIIEDMGAVIDPIEKTITFPNGIVFNEDITEVFKHMKTREEAERFFKFVDLLAANPRKYVHESLTYWIMTNPSLNILEDGRIQGYRGLNSDFSSIRSGYGIVNGVEVNGNHDNSPGNILEFPVELTDHNASHACSIGLHVGTKKYAEQYGQGKYVTVAFSPADVVSSVEDSRQEKLRVSKMEILEEFFPENPKKYY